MKRIICLMLALILCLSSSAMAFADYTSVREDVKITEGGGGGRAEETIWYYRITYDGLYQRRLWSLTYGYWLTDWETIGYVDP